MTASQLLLYIVVAILFQLMVGVGVAMWRRRVRSGEPSEGALPQPTAAPSAAWQGWREFRVARRTFEDSANTQCSFYLEPVDGAPLPPFKPGQFLTFDLLVGDATAPAAGRQRRIIRCYSLSDRPDPASYRVTIKRVPPPADRPSLPPGAGSNHFHDHVQPGDVLKIKAPAGQFFIDPDPQIPAVLIAGGIGITPMMSMLRWCLLEQPERTVHLFYGLRHGSEHAFKQQLEELASTHPTFHLHVAYSRPGPNDVQGRDFEHAGHVDVDLLQRKLPPVRHQFYVCGPPAMMASLIPALGAVGVSERDIHQEAFGPASTVVGTAATSPLPAHPIEVKFHRSRRTLVWDGLDANLLDFAERHDVAVESGCRSGSCGACETVIVSGSVRYAREPDHEIAPGHCLLCVGTPESALVVEA